MQEADPVITVKETHVAAGKIKTLSASTFTLPVFLLKAGHDRGTKKVLSWISEWNYITKMLTEHLIIFIFKIF